MNDALLLNPAEVRARHILRYVFRYGADFPLRVSSLVDSLSSTPDCDAIVLDRSPESLAHLEQAISRIGGAVALDRYFPHLVAYMGEVLIEVNGGSWYMLWRPDHGVWEPYVVTDAGEFCDPFTRLYDQLSRRSGDLSLTTALEQMMTDAGLRFELPPIASLQ